MCLAEPVKVLAVEGLSAKVDVEGEVRTVDSSLVRGLKTGDHVLVHGSMIIQKLTRQDAKETLRLIREIEG